MVLFWSEVFLTITPIESSMPKIKLSLAERKKRLEETKQTLRLQQEARTIARIEELEIEACERLGRQLQLEHKELSGELECSETDTVRQYTLVNPSIVSFTNLW